MSSCNRCNWCIDSSEGSSSSVVSFSFSFRYSDFDAREMGGREEDDGA